MYQVVNFCAAADSGGSGSRAVNRDIRADLDVITDQHMTDLRNLAVLTRQSSDNRNHPPQEPIRDGSGSPYRSPFPAEE